MQLTATIDRFENNKAILVLDSGEQINWPKNQLPQACQEGDILHLEISTKAEIRAKKEKQAKEILNELLDINES